MSATQRLPFIAKATAAGASLAAVVSIPALRSHVSRLLGVRSPGSVWRVLFILLALANLKNLPLVWHWRVFRALYYHLYFERSTIEPKSLFKPIVMASRSPMFEADYNLHKSNSTYFSDLDISRTHLMSILLRAGRTEKYHWERVEDGLVKTLAFGGVTCHFRREIKPYEKYEVWTRLLSWDRKWIYLVSHLVKAGVAKPSAYEMQPWRKQRAARTDAANDKGASDGDQERKQELKKAVFASSISKYVFKKGRITMPPGPILEQFGLIPAAPAVTENGHGVQSQVLSEPNGEAVSTLEETVLPSVVEFEWTWEKIEAERLRGMRYAEMFAGLDGLHDEFEGGEGGVLGDYPDVLF